MKSFGDELICLLTKQASRTINSVTNVAKTKAGEVLCTTLIGMTESAAKVACATTGFKFKINSKDGKDRIGDARVHTNRIKVNIENGKVIKARIG